MRRHATMLVVPALLLGGALQAGEVAYVEWSRADDDKRWGYAAFDGDEATAWCSGQDGVGDTLTLGFVGPRKVDEIGLIVGARQKGEHPQPRGGKAINEGEQAICRICCRSHAEHPSRERAIPYRYETDRSLVLAVVPLETHVPFGFLTDGA